jgi:hypothetical protein
MKRQFKFTLLASVIMVLFSCEISEGSQSFQTGNLSYVRKEGEEWAAFTAFLWDGKKTNMSVSLPVYPEKGYPATMLGFRDKTNHVLPFHVSLQGIQNTHNFMSYDVSEVSSEEIRSSDYWLGCLGSVSLELISLRFDVMVPWTVVSIPGASTREVFIEEPDDGSQAKVYLPEFYFSVDEANETFYSKEGRIYWKNGDKLVELSCYETGVLASDFLPEESRVGAKL